MQRRYHHLLSASARHPVVALDAVTVAKLFNEDASSNIEAEAAAMRYANDINDLVVKLVRIDFDEQLDADILVMERLYGFEYRTYELEQRTLWLEAFEYELGQLHEAGWVHRKLYDAAGTAGTFFDNILLTNQGIRLIDMSRAALRDETGDSVFEKYVREDRQAVRMFKEYFLRR